MVIYVWTRDIQVVSIWNVCIFYVCAILILRSMLGGQWWCPHEIRAALRYATVTDMTWTLKQHGLVCWRLFNLARLDESFANDCKTFYQGMVTMDAEDLAMLVLCCYIKSRPWKWRSNRSGCRRLPKISFDQVGRLKLLDRVVEGVVLVFMGSLFLGSLYIFHLRIMASWIIDSNTIRTLDSSKMQEVLCSDKHLA